MITDGIAAHSIAVKYQFGGNVFPIKIAVATKATKIGIKYNGLIRFNWFGIYSRCHTQFLENHRSHFLLIFFSNF